MFNARWEDEQRKEKSRYAVKDFANTRDPTMFAAGVSKLQDVHDRCDVGVHACWEDELVFLEPPLEEIEEHGDCVWRSIRVIYGRRKVQDHGRSILTPSSEARRHGNEVSRWNRIKSVRHFITHARRMA